MAYNFLWVSLGGLKSGQVPYQFFTRNTNLMSPSLPDVRIPFPVFSGYYRTCPNLTGLDSLPPIIDHGESEFDVPKFAGCRIPFPVINGYPYFIYGCSLIRLPSELTI